MEQGGCVLHVETAAGSMCGERDTAGQTPLPQGTRYNNTSVAFHGAVIPNFFSISNTVYFYTHTQ